MAKRVKPKKESVEQYTHENSKRSNNPPVGLVTPKTDPDQESKKYQHDPRLDPQLQWAGKQENLEFDVDTVSLHVHERIDPHTILEKAMKPDRAAQQSMFNYFDAPENNPPLRHAIEFYKHDQNWSNRLIAGDSLLVMNSLLQKEGMASKVQMIYIDPPYGIKYGSNFQPFTNKTSVTDRQDITQEPETIKAFRDTWELDIHSYLSYLRDRLLLARELLTESGSCFVQISDENVHLIRMLMDEIFGAKNFISQITYKVTSGFERSLGPRRIQNYIVWYAKQKEQCKFHRIFLPKDIDKLNFSLYKQVEENGIVRSLTSEEKKNPKQIPAGYRLFVTTALHSMGTSKREPREFEGKTYKPPSNRQWVHTKDTFDAIVRAGRVIKERNSIRFKLYMDDFPYEEQNTVWNDTGPEMSKIYTVQTSPKVIQRCLLMTTDPGDLVLDPTCGSGTTAYVAEQWGRRWITCDTSRVAISLAKQRLMTAADYDYYELAHPNEGISGGFKYKTVPRITPSSIADTPGIRKGMTKSEIDEAIRRSAPQETLYDQPDIDQSRNRISGPFTVEATPSPVAKSIDIIFEDEPHSNLHSAGSRHEEWRNEMSKTGIRGRGGEKIEFSIIEPHPTTRWLHADAQTKECRPKRAVISFGPEHAPLEQRQVALAIEEAQTLVPQPKMIIFAAMQFDPEAAKDIDETNWPDVAILKVEMNKDLLTKDLKKKRSSNESFWLVGQPDAELKKTESGEYVVKIKGFDYYNTKTGEIESGDSSKIAMWMLDTDYDGRSVYPQQVFFPMDGENGGWNKLAKTLQSQIDEELISRYQGTESIPFEAGPNKRAAVKIIDDRGIESLKIIALE